jgi:hypothetical protein
MGEFHTFDGITVLIPSGFTTSAWTRETPADEEKDPTDAQT